MNNSKYKNIREQRSYKTNILFHEQINQDNQKPTLVIIYDIKTGYETLITKMKWCRENEQNIAMVNIRTNWHNVSWHLNAKMYETAIIELQETLAELLSISNDKGFYFLGNEVMQSLIIDLLQRNYPLRKYFLGLISQDGSSIDIKSLNLIKINKQIGKSEGFRYYFSKFYRRMVVCHISKLSWQ